MSLVHSSNACPRPIRSVQAVEWRQRGGEEGKVTKECSDRWSLTSRDGQHLVPHPLADAGVDEGKKEHLLWESDKARPEWTALHGHGQWV